MTILLDTNVLIDHLRGNERARSALLVAQADGQRLAASVLSRTELRAGLRAREGRRLELLLEELEWVPVNEDVADRAGALAARFRRSHPGIEVVDYVIAATAEALDAALWTLNLRHFPMLGDLEPPY